MLKCYAALQLLFSAQNYRINECKRHNLIWFERMVWRFGKHFNICICYCICTAPNAKCTNRGIVLVGAHSYCICILFFVYFSIAPCLLHAALGIQCAPKMINAFYQMSCIEFKLWLYDKDIISFLLPKLLSQSQLLKLTRSANQIDNIATQPVSRTNVINKENFSSPRKLCSSLELTRVASSIYNTSVCFTVLFA